MSNTGRDTPSRTVHGHKHVLERHRCGGCKLWGGRGDGGGDAGDDGNGGKRRWSMDGATPAHRERKHMSDAVCGLAEPVCCSE